MALKIKFSRRGAKKKPFYRIIVAPARSKRDGKIVDLIGFYDPKTSPPTVKVDRDKLDEWTRKGAKPTNSVKMALEFKRGK